MPPLVKHCMQVKTPGYRLGSNVEDEHQMVEPEQYRGVAGSGTQGAQPFRIEVTPAAQVRFFSTNTYRSAPTLFFSV